MPEGFQEGPAGKCRAQKTWQMESRGSEWVYVCMLEGPAGGGTRWQPYWQGFVGKNKACARVQPHPPCPSPSTGS